jgi:hypothetical protein
VECGTSLQICAMRATLLNDDGSVASASNNSYVSDRVTEVGWTPDILAGTESDMPGGCDDCLAHTFKGKDKLRRFGFALSRSAIEPALTAMMLGWGTVDSGADAIGLVVPFETQCVTERKVAFEFWTKHWVNDEKDSTWPWWHHIYPSTIWQIGDQTFNAELGPFVINGFSRTNTLWGDGPYGDGPGVDHRRGTFFLTDIDPPSGACGFAHVAPGS